MKFTLVLISLVGAIAAICPPNYMMPCPPKEMAIVDDSLEDGFKFIDFNTLQEWVSDVYYSRTPI